MSQQSSIRRLYDWLLHWAATPYGGIVLFVWSFAESSFFPIPPDAFLIAMVLGARLRAFYFATLISIASVLGGIAGYLVGSYLWWASPGEFSAIAQLFFDNVPGFSAEQFERVQGLYDRWDFWVVFTAGFTPIPYKIITISAGAFDISFAIFVIASALSRAARFFLVAYLLWRYGEPIREFIDRRFSLLSILFVILLVGGFYLIRFWSH
jgi:membrane protein YqaA with SNARE-associated domain